MEGWISKVPQEYIIFWVIMFCALVYLLIKFVPKVVTTFNKLRKHINNLEDIASAVDKNTKDIESINQRLTRDYQRINDLEKLQRAQNDFLEEFSTENELILRSLMGVVQGLQEIGANGPTKRVEADIQDYLLKKAHKMNSKFSEYNKHHKDEFDHSSSDDDK